MSLNDIFPVPPKPIDMSEIKTKEKESNPVNTSKGEIVKATVVLYLILMGTWQTGWNVFCFVKPDATTFKNLKGMEAKERAYMEAYLDACSMGNYFENKENKCAIAGSAVATLIKGEAVIAQVGSYSVPLSKQEERKALEAQAEATEEQPGNAQSPAN